MREKRDPTFMDKKMNQGESKLKVRLWGNTPAFDLIGFKCNEHKDNSNWQKPVNLAFVTSGDFRSMVETLASVPDDYQQPITIVLNDKDPLIVARNMFMLSLLLTKGEEALDMVIAIWYSAAMSSGQLCAVALSLSDFYSAKPDRIGFGFSVVEFQHLEGLWDMISSMFHHSKDVDFATAMIPLRKIMVMEREKDSLSRVFLGLQDYHRESVLSFLSMGLVLPYQQHSKWVLKDTQNGFLIDHDVKWLIDETCDPKQGWSMIEVMEFGDKKELPKNDIYGRLFFYIRDRLSKMLSTMRRLPVTVKMFQKDPLSLAKDLQSVKFDRIDLSNATDQSRHRIDKMLNIWGPLMNRDNPNSAIVTLSQNWKDLLPESVEISSVSPHLLSRMVSLIGLDRVDMLDMTNPVNKFLTQDAVVKFGDHSEEFEKYMKKIEKKKPNNLKRRIEHTIVPHQVMFPVEAKPNTTIESLSESDQYWIFNCTANPIDRYSEWTLGEK